MIERKRLAVIGDPIAHSLSPLLHNTLAQTLALPYVYDMQRVPLEALPQWLLRVREENISGFNATMPHKIHLMPLLDELTEDAHYYGAVNTVRNDGGRLIGHNTDAEGFVRMMREHGTAFSGAIVTILGAGGAANAIVRRAVRDGAAHITVMNRTLQNAQRLCELRPAAMRACSLSSEIPSDTEILINTLPIGNFIDEDSVYKLSNNCKVFDILYAPPKTPLLQSAERRGLLAVNGLGMLIHQAILAFSFFTGETVDERALAKKLYAVVENDRIATENIK